MCERLARSMDLKCHLMFASDFTVFLQGTKEMQTYILKILEWFCEISSQIFNNNMSEVFFSPNTPEQCKDLVLALKVKKAKRPGKYLGLTELEGKTVIASW